MADLATARREVDQLLATAPPAWRAEYARGVAAVVSAGLPAPGPLTREGALAILGITAGGRPSGDAARGPNAVPAAVRAEALEGLRLSHAHNYGAWHFIGIARAVQLATEPGVPDTTLARVRAYFSRHAADRDAPGYARLGAPSRGRLAWLNWGGDAAAAWAKAPVGGMMSGEHFGLTRAEDGDYFDEEAFDEILHYFKGALPRLSRGTLEVTSGGLTNGHPLTVGRILADNGSVFDYLLRVSPYGLSFAVQNTAYVERNVPTHHFWHASQPRLHPDGTTRPTRGALPGEAETIRKLLDGGYTLEIGNYLAFLVIFDRQMMRGGYHGAALGASTFAARVRGIFAAFRR